MATQDAHKGNRQVFGNIQLETFKVSVQIARQQIPDDAAEAILDEIEGIQDCM